MPDEDPQITYSVRDILERIEAKIDSALTALRLKADAADVANLARKVSDLHAWQDSHDRAHEAEAEKRTEKRDGRRWLTGTIIAGLGIAIAILTTWITIHP